MSAIAPAIAVRPRNAGGSVQNIGLVAPYPIETIDTAIRDHGGRVPGMEEPEARVLLMDLMEHANQPAFVYTHRWSVNDLVMSDNRCTMHRAREYDETQVRDMHRITGSDGMPTVAA